LTTIYNKIYYMSTERYSYPRVEAGDGMEAGLFEGAMEED
jgi:hypothetical protein